MTDLQELAKIRQEQEDRILKENLIGLVKHHKEHCDGPDCSISLFRVLTVAEKSGLKFTEEEKKYFR
jgi:hypothetical protein